VGFGDFPCTTYDEFCLSFIFMIFGSIYFGILIGNMTSYTNEGAGKAQEFSNKLRALLIYRRKYRLPD
jgi:hypothetical protein